LQLSDWWLTMNLALVTYLNDHLAGSVAALELLDRLIEHPAEPDDRSFFSALRDEIAADQQVLRQLIDQLGSGESHIRKAAGWLAEKATGFKLRWDDPDDEGFRRFEALEALSLGTHGKRALWQALAAMTSRPGPVDQLDLDGLIRRADDQHIAVERRRLAAASRAFAETGAERR
jgi:hypothetical protein